MLGNQTLEEALDTQSDDQPAEGPFAERDSSHVGELGLVVIDFGEKDAFIDVGYGTFEPPTVDRPWVLSRAA